MDNCSNFKREPTDGAEQKLSLPAGFRFHPTDEELVVYYLCRKCASQRIDVPIIAEIDLYKFDPWELPGMALYGEKEWYFFSPRDRKYPNGCRPNRAAGTGYWKATGADKPIGKPKSLGIKKALVFYAGKAPKGIKTNWIMHEYRLANVDRSAGKKSNLRLDEWVLCRIYNKKGTLEKYNTVNMKQINNSPEVLDPIPKPNLNSFKQEPQENHQQWMQQQQRQQQQQTMHHGLFGFDTSESDPRLHTDTSASEHVLSPEFCQEKEVQSAHKWNDLESSVDNDYHQVMNYMDGFQDDDLFGAQMKYNDRYFSPLQDIFMNNQKPFSFIS